MKPNRSIPDATVIPVLTYPDVREAVDWLVRALGFAERVWIGPNHRAQLSCGSGALIVADVSGERRSPRPGEVTHSIHLRVDDARAALARAEEAGARVLTEPTDFAYGERQCALEDPWGHRWTLTETLRDAAPEEWGGVTVA
jgi:uncharacterized glyoxalase superfamily protein PhnB